MPLAGPESAGAIAIERASNAGLTFQAAMETASALPELPWTIYLPIGAVLAGAVAALWLRNNVLNDRIYNSQVTQYAALSDIAERAVTGLDAITITAREGNRLLEELHEVLVTTVPAKRERRA